MKKLDSVSFWIPAGAAILVAASFGVDAALIFGQDDVDLPPPTREEFDALADRVALIEVQLGDAETPEVPDVPPPPVLIWPKVDPITIALDNETLTLPPAVGREWQTDSEWRYCVRRATIGNAMAVVTLEQFAGYDATRVTWALVNGFAETGAILFDDLAVRLGRRTIYSIVGDDVPGPDAIQVRGILARRYYAGRDAASLAAYEHVEPVAGYPDWTPDVCEQGLAWALNGAQLIGPYRIGNPVVKGASSLNGSHGGWKVAPWHMGPEGWQRASRVGWRWAEVDFFDTLDRSPVAVFDRETLRPTNPHVPYWPGRANSPLPGWEPDPDPACEYLPELEKWEAHAYSHLHRETCAAAFLAERDVFARFVLVEIYWNDISLWLDGAESTIDLFQTAEQVIRDLPAGEGWGNGGRGFAHSVRCLIWALPYFPGAARDDLSEYDPAVLASGARWADVIPELIEHVARPNGIIHSWLMEPNHPEIAPAARAREVDLMYPNLVYLGLDDIARACRRTMRPTRTDSVGAAFESNARHWTKGDHLPANYYQPYDWIRGIGLETFDPTKRWHSPMEQSLSIVPPEILLGGGR